MLGLSEHKEDFDLELELAAAACLAAILMSRGCQELSRRRHARLLRELDWVADGVDLEEVLRD